MQKAPRHSGADRFPNRFAATGATGAISIRWPAQNHLRYRTVAWKTIHSPGGSIWSIGFGTGLAVRRRISSLGPISGPNNPNWAFGFIPAIHRYLDHLIHGVNGPNGPGSFILLNRYIGKWTESDIDVGIPLRRFLVRHVIVVLG